MRRQSRIFRRGCEKGGNDRDWSDTIQERPKCPQWNKHISWRSRIVPSFSPWEKRDTSHFSHFLLGPPLVLILVLISPAGSRGFILLRVSSVQEVLTISDLSNMNMNFHMISWPNGFLGYRKLDNSSYDLNMECQDVSSW